MSCQWMVLYSLWAAPMSSQDYRSSSPLSQMLVSVSHCADAVINFRKLQDSLQMSEKSLFMVFLECTDP